MAQFNGRLLTLLLVTGADFLPLQVVHQRQVDHPRKRALIELDRGTYIPMMDVRAPVEFDKGAFPGVINLPLMNDLEREKVGTCYKQQGQQAAIELGHRLVSGSIKEQRIQAWADFARARPDGLLYCFRGGLRSQLTQQWLKTEAGIDYPRVINGYKAMRTYLIEVTDNAVAECDLVLVGGLTGSGKT